MIKNTVDLRNLTPQMAVAHTIACLVYFKITNDPMSCVITSGFDSKHGSNTLHQRDGLCRALDLRTNSLPNQETVEKVHRELKLALGPQFDVVLEKDHIHMEFDPKDQPPASKET